jgi:hypothetical protein
MTTINHLAPEGGRYARIHYTEIERIPENTWATKISYYTQGEQHTSVHIHRDELEGRETALKLAEDHGVLVQYFTLSGHDPVGSHLLVEKITVTPSQRQERRDIDIQHARAEYWDRVREAEERVADDRRHLAHLAVLDQLRATEEPGWGVLAES